MNTIRNAFMRTAPWLLLSVLVASCRETTPAESLGARNLRVVNSTLRERQLDTLSVATPASTGSWLMALSADTAQLVVAHPIVALGLPDGPFEVLEPVTFFRFVDSTWTQFAPLRGTDTLPTRVHRALEAQFTNRDHVYFYVVKRVALGAGGALSDSTISAIIRETFDRVERDAKRLKTAPFIGADAEP